MKILFLVNHLNTGGITSYLLTLASGLKKKGHDLFIASGGGELLPRFSGSGITHIQIPIRTKNEISPKILASALKLKRFIRDNKIEILHSNSRTTQVLGCLLSKFLGVKHISTCHGFFKRRFSRILFPCWGERVIAISEQVKEHLIVDFGLSGDKIILINNGIDVDKFMPADQREKIEAKSRLGLSAGPVIGILARLSDVKGHEYLIEAMKVVSVFSSEAQLLIAGAGKMEEKLRRISGSLNIGKTIFFITKTVDTREILSAIDIFVMPSLKEGLGLALMEAMASGLPVVGSNVGGIKTLIKDGRNGILVEPGDSAGIAKAIVGLLSDPGKSAELGLNARKYISEEFSQEKMVLETERFYTECLRKIE